MKTRMYALALLLVAGGLVQGAPAPIAWDVHDVDHPVMGAIRVAIPRSGVTTEANGVRIVSAAFVSCEKAPRTIAIELANSVESDTKGGLPPAEMPRLVCSTRANGVPVRTEIRTRWTTNELGDVLARGIAPADLQRCTTLEVQQHVTLPPGKRAVSTHLAMTLVPDERELASVLATCTEPTAVASASEPPASLAEPSPKLGSMGADRPPKLGSMAADSPPRLGSMAADPSPKLGAPKGIARPAAPSLAARSAPTAAPPAATASESTAWKRARTLPGSRTNVRAEPRIDSGLLTQIPAGTRVLAQKAAGDWWRVKPAAGNGFSGYIRDDRLAFD